MYIHIIFIFSVVCSLVGFRLSAFLYDNLTGTGTENIGICIGLTGGDHIDIARTCINGTIDLNLCIRLGTCAFKQSVSCACYNCTGASCGCVGNRTTPNISGATISPPCVSIVHINAYTITQDSCCTILDHKFRARQQRNILVHGDGSRLNRHGHKAVDRQFVTRRFNRLCADYGKFHRYGQGIDRSITANDNI